MTRQCKVTSVVSSLGELTLGSSTTYENAKKFCSSHGSQMATLSSQEQLDEISDILYECNSDDGVLSRQSDWIVGLKLQDGAGTWSDGHKYDGGNEVEVDGGSQSGCWVVSLNAKEKKLESSNECGRKIKHNVVCVDPAKPSKANIALTVGISIGFLLLLFIIIACCVKKMRRNPRDVGHNLKVISVPTRETCASSLRHDPIPSQIV